MEYRVLKYFLTVAQEENITRAAETLHTTQSNLSRQLAELESRVGKKLFDRGSRRITLTEEGMFLRRRAAEIVELIERTETELAAFDEAVSGTVHIGAAETHAMRLLADDMLALRAVHPGVCFDIFSGSTIEVTEQLNRGLLDFAVLVEPVDLSRYEYLKFPTADAFGLLLRRDHPLAARRQIAPEDVLDQPLICSRQQLDGNVLSSWLGRDVNTLNIVSTFNLITTPAMMVEAGLGLAFCFDHLVYTGPDSPLCFRPLEPKVETGLYLAWKKYQVFSKAAEMFLRFTQEHLFQS